ncbi:STAS domain-containing protein [Risungbinella massiliensis]|uniref:STAS domain-containing protein n=1 Tax=Risungbinella massiliensis TaxID=1329796 RepID=UPI0005CC5CA2|nr:STAS domain-containing protein [Risungbinella massiliensis]
MNFVVKELPETSVGPTIAVEGEIDVYTAPQLREKLLPLCATEQTVTVNLREVEYIDSTGLGVLIGAYKAQRSVGGKLVLVGMNQRLQRLFRITGLDEVMEIEQKVQEDEKV